MATIVEHVEGIEASKLAIKNAIRAKGVSVADTDKLNTYAGKIESIETGDGWTRPSDRPEVPEVNENEIYMLFGVQEHSPNDYAITLTATKVEGWIVNWGDGIIEEFGNTTKCEHIYNYALLDVVPNADGIKWVWIKFYTSATDNPFTVINTSVRSEFRPAASAAAIYSPQIYEIYLNAPEVKSWSWGSSSYTRFFNLEIFDWQGTNKLTICTYFLGHSYNLKKFKMYTGLATAFNYFLAYCYSFNQPLDIDTSNSTSFQYFLYYCQSFNQPLNIDTSKGISFQSFMSNCRTFNRPLGIDTSKGTNFTSFMYYCDSMTHKITVNLISAISAIGTNFIGTANFSLTALRLLNMDSVHTALTISGSSLTADALVDLFNDLYDRSSTTTGTLTITNVYGADKLTRAQLAIATGKGWTVTGASTID